MTVANESAPDKTARIAEENAGTPGTVYTVQPGQRMERDGVILEAGTQIQVRPGESVADLIARGIIA